MVLRDVFERLNKLKESETKWNQVTPINQVVTDYWNRLSGDVAVKAAFQLTCKNSRDKKAITVGKIFLELYILRCKKAQRAVILGVKNQTVEQEAKNKQQRRAAKVLAFYYEFHCTEIDNLIKQRSWGKAKIKLKAMTEEVKKTTGLLNCLANNVSYDGDILQMDSFNSLQGSIDSLVDLSRKLELRSSSRQCDERKRRAEEYLRELQESDDEGDQIEHVSAKRPRSDSSAIPEFPDPAGASTPTMPSDDKKEPMLAAQEKANNETTIERARQVVGSERNKEWNDALDRRSAQNYKQKSTPILSDDGGQTPILSEDPVDDAGAAKRQRLVEEDEDTETARILQAQEYEFDRRLAQNDKQNSTPILSDDGGQTPILSEDPAPDAPEASGWGTGFESAAPPAARSRWTRKNDGYFGDDVIYLLKKLRIRILSGWVRAEYINHQTFRESPMKPRTVTNLWEHGDFILRKLNPKAHTVTEKTFFGCDYNKLGYRPVNFIDKTTTKHDVVLKKVYGGGYEKAEVEETNSFEYVRDFKYENGQQTNQPEQAFLFTPDLTNFNFALICRNPEKSFVTKQNKQYGIDDAHAAFRMYRVKDNQEMEIVKDEWGSNRIVRFSIDGGDCMDENIFGADVDNDMVVTPKLTLEFEVVNRQDFPNIPHN